MESASEAGEGDEVPLGAAHVARDPFDPRFDPEAVVTRMRRSTSGVKTLVLNQRIVSGFGNIYADETLWRVGLHHARRGTDLSRKALLEVLEPAVG